MSDFHGKVLVLFFYEQECPRCRGLIPERNKVVDQFKDKPVKFIAIGAGDSLADANTYVKGTRLEMPSFADDLGVMEHRYGFHISMNNVYQFRIIGPKGNMVFEGITMDPPEIEQALKSVKWKFKDGGYDPKLNGIIDLLEWNQYESAIRQLRPLVKGTTKLNESAAKLYEAVKTDGNTWLKQAEKAEASDPIKACDLYSKIASDFAGDDLAKTADAALKSLAKDKAVNDELAARRLYAGLDTAMSKATAKQRPDVMAFAQSIAQKYPNCPTGKRAADLAKEIEAAAMAMAAK
jgi:thiol-disulfide isomerase/thioredoxin